MKQFIQKQGIYVVIGALILAGLIYYFEGRSNGRVPHEAFFMDESSGKELVRPNTDVPPLTGADGKASVVGVFKYSIDGGKTAIVAYYYKFTPDMKAKLEGTPDADRGTIDSMSGELVRSPEPGSKWVAMRSEEGQGIITNINCPPGHDVQRVFP